MLRSQTLIGRQVVRPSGEVLGHVRNLIVDHTTARVLAFTVEPVVQLERPVVPFEAVYELHQDAVVVMNGDDLVPIRQLPRLSVALRNSLRFGEARLVNAQGEALGVIEGVRFDEETGELLGYEITHPEATECGPLVVPARQVEHVGDHATASATTAFLLEQVTTEKHHGPFSLS